MSHRDPLGHRRLKKRDPPGHRPLKTLLVVGFLLLGWGILAARGDPANGYEVSIYGATSLGFWLGIGVALLVSVVTVAYAARSRVATLGLVLGGGAVTAVAALPVIRGYGFYGLADSLTHLGWARAIEAGQMSAFELIYPGGHVASVLIGSLGGISVDRSMMLVVLATVVAYFVFVPLMLRVLVPDRIAVAIAAISAFLLLPINLVGTHMMFHPFTQATLLFPLLLFLLFKHVTGDAEDASVSTVTSAAGLVLPAAGAALMFVHPQTGLNVLIFFGTVSAVQVFYRRYRPNHRISQYRAIYGQTLFLTVLFFAWNLGFWQTFSMLDGLVAAIWNTIIGTGTAGAIVQDRGESISGVGGSFAEMFVKLFLVSAVYVALSVALVSAKLFQRFRQNYPDNDVAIAYFTFSGFTLGPFFLAHYLGDISNFFFRHVGFVMVVVTLLGASAIYGLQRPLGGISRSFFRPFAVILVMVMLVLSLVVVFPSPFVYKHNAHVSDQLMDGYGQTFAFAPDAPTDSEEAVLFVGIRTGPGRFADAIGATDIGYTGAVNESVLRTNLTTHLASQTGADRDYYLPVGEVDRQREVAAYRGFRYPPASLDAIGTQQGVNRIRANGDFTLYYIDTSFAGDVEPGQEQEVENVGQFEEQEDEEGEPEEQQDEPTATPTATPTPVVEETPTPTATPTPEVVDTPTETTDVVETPTEITEVVDTPTEEEEEQTPTLTPAEEEGTPTETG